MTESLPPLLNQTALLKELGFTPVLIESLLHKPDKVSAKKKGRYSWIEHIYTRDRVVEAMRDERFVAHIAKREERKAAIARRQAELPKRYATWKDALPEACAGMFSLNRYAKHRSCSSLHRVEIYRLKNELVELLYREGYSTASFIHRLFLEKQLCRECGGAGDLDCWKCGGSGEWKPAKTIEFWCFEFLIAGKVYSWHQPIALVKFAPMESVPPQDMEHSAVKEKPILIRRQQFAEMKSLLRWVLQAAAQSPGSIGSGNKEVSQGAGLPFDLGSGSALLLLQGSPA